MDINESNIDKKNTTSLPKPLRDILDSIENEVSNKTRLAHGTDDDVLVIVSESKEIDEEFVKSIGEKVLENDRDAGVVVGEAPDSYENNFSAYIRLNPDEPREYIIPFGVGLDMDMNDIAQVSDLADKEQGYDDAKLRSAILIYENQIDKNEGAGIEEIADVSGLDLSKIRSELMSRN